MELAAGPITEAYAALCKCRIWLGRQWSKRKLTRSFVSHIAEEVETQAARLPEVRLDMPVPDMVLFAQHAFRPFR